MKIQKNCFVGNLKFLRERKKLSQEALAEKLALSRSKLNALENGQTKSPRPEDLIASSEFFRISIDSLLKVDLSKLGELKLRELESGSDVYMTGTQIRVLAISVDKKNRENMEYVPIKAKAGYHSGFNDPGFISELPKFNFPNLPKGGTYRMFPTTGDSMLPIPEGSDIITRYIEDWTSIKTDTLCIVILKGEQDFVFKQVTVQNNKTVLLKSLNNLYEPYQVPINDVLEIWQFVKYLTHEIPEQAVEMQQLMGMMKAMKEGIISIKDKVG